MQCCRVGDLSGNEAMFIWWESYADIKNGAGREHLVGTVRRYKNKSGAGRATFVSQNATFSIIFYKKLFLHCIIMQHYPKKPVSML